MVNIAIMIKMVRFYLVTVFVLSSILTNAQTKVIAHRGFSSVAPENTLAAFQEAITIGADYFELDVHKTKDDSVIVIHDSSVERTSSNGMSGKIEELTYQELTAIKVGYNKIFKDKFKDEKIPTLREALELAKGKIKVCIEIKVYGVEKEVLAAVNDLEMNDDVVIFSFHYPVLAKIRQFDKKISILFLKGKADGKTIYYGEAISANAIGVGMGTTVTKEYLELAHAKGMELWQWTVNDDEEMQKLVDLGIDGIITNFPDKALKLLGQ